jgi:hypothetical protein
LDSAGAAGVGRWSVLDHSARCSNTCVSRIKCLSTEHL